MAHSQPPSDNARRHRRVTRAAPAGSDPNPSEQWQESASEDDPKRWGDAPVEPNSSPEQERSGNEERLRRDKPPHWS